MDNIPDLQILKFLSIQSRWSTHGEGYSMPTVRDVMPEGTTVDMQIQKMSSLLKQGYVDGCDCGCRGDWNITYLGMLRAYQNDLSLYPREHIEVLEEKLKLWKRDHFLRNFNSLGYYASDIEVKQQKNNEQCFDITFTFVKKK